MQITLAPAAGAGAASVEPRRAALIDTGASLRELTAASTAQPTPPAGGALLRSVDGFLILQQAASGPARRREAVRRGDRLLDSLGRVELALANGAMPHDALAGLQAELAAGRPPVDDPELAQILDAIELRAAVEAAKLEAGCGPATI